MIFLNFTSKLFSFGHPPVSVTVTSLSSRRFPMKIHGSTSASVSPDTTGIGLTRFKSATSSLSPSGNRMRRTAAKPRFTSLTVPHVNEGTVDWVRTEPLKFVEIMIVVQKSLMDRVELFRSKIIRSTQKSHGPARGSFKFSSTFLSTLNSILIFDLNAQRHFCWH